MKYRLKFQHTFEKEAKHLGKRYMSMKSDIASLSEELLANPHLGTDLGRRIAQDSHGYHLERERQERRRAGYYLYGSGSGGRERNQLALHLR